MRLRFFKFRFLADVLPDRPLAEEDVEDVDDVDDVDVDSAPADVLVEAPANMPPMGPGIAVGRETSGAASATFEVIFSARRSDRRVGVEDIGGVLALLPRKKLLMLESLKLPSLPSFSPSSPLSLTKGVGALGRENSRALPLPLPFGPGWVGAGGCS